jgi:hypothetical protein
MATAQQVTQLYNEILGRAPDAGGLSFYQGWSDVNKIRQDMLGSAEYRNRVSQQQAAPAPAPTPSAPYQQQADRLFGELTNFDKTAKDPLSVYNDALAKLGIADARTRVQSTKQQLMNTENLLRNVEGSVSGRTQNSLVTEAQKQRLVAMEQAPLNEAMRIQGQNFDLASGDYNRIMGEGKVQSDLFIQGQAQKRQALIDRLEIARDNAKTAEDRRRWQIQIDLQKQKMAQEQNQWQQEFDLKKVQASRAASSGGGSGGSSGGSSGASMSALDSWFDTQWKKKPYASRQEQDAWINSWFAASGITDPEDRQQYWNYINTTRKRPENPHDDWLYKK